MNVINAQTGETEDLSPDDLAIGLANGTHLPPAGQGVLLNPNGKLVFTPAEQVSDAVTKYGYKIPQPDELKTMGESYKYESGTSQLGAFVAGAARGASFGVSDWLATQSGAVDPETLRKLQEYNPGLSVSGQLAGAIGSAFIPGSAVARLGGAARQVEAATAGALTSALSKSKAASEITKLAIETGAKGLGGAIEGLAFGLGQTVSEAALGDPDLTAQKVLSTLGTSAFLGGALGAAIVPGGLVIKKSVDKAKDAYKSMFEKVIGKFDDVPPTGAAPTVNTAENVVVKNAASDTPAGTIISPAQEIPEPKLFQAEIPVEPGTFKPGVFTRAQTKLRSMVTGESEDAIINRVQKDMSSIYMTAQQQDEVSTNLYNTLKELHSRVESASRKTSGPVRQAEMENLLVGAPIEPAIAQSQRIIDDAASIIQNMTDETVAYRYDQGLIKDFSKRLEGFSLNAETFDSASQHFKAINELKQMVDELTEVGKKDLMMMPRQERNTVLVLKEFAKDLRQSLTDQTTWGQAAARQSAYNEAITDYLKKTGRSSWFRKYFTEKKGTEYVVTPTKVKQFIRFVNDSRGLPRNQGLEEFLGSSKKLIDEIETTYKNVPQESFDTAALKDYVYKASDTASASRDFAASHAGGLGYVTDMMEAVRQGGITGGMAEMAKGFGSAISDPATTVNVLSRLEKQAAATTKAINKASKVIFGLLRPSGKAVEILKEPLTPDQKKEKYLKAIKKLNDMSMNTTDFMDELEKATSPTYGAAPKISQALQQNAIRGLTFLATKVPQQPLAGPLDKPAEPTVQQVNKFMRYYTAVENPLVILSELEANTVRPETVEVLDNVYPQLAAEIKTTLLSELADQMANKSAKIDYQRRVVLSTFLKTSLDASLAPSVLVNNQKIFAARGKAEEPEQAVRTSQAGLGNVSLADRSQTNLTKTMLRA